MEKENERRKRFFPQVSLGSVLAALTFVASAASVYTSLVTKVEAQGIEIQNIKVNEVKREDIDKTARTEIRQEIRDVKMDVKDMNNKLDRILFELNKMPKPPERNGR